MTSEEYVYNRIVAMQFMQLLDAGIKPGVAMAGACYSAQEAIAEFKPYSWEDAMKNKYASITHIK
jgi:hypothetical protein